MGADKDTPSTSNHRMQTARHRWIAEAAYFKAEARQFAANHALDDWLEAEKEYAELQVKKFLANHEEVQGIFSLAELQQLAKTVGIQNPENIRLEAKLIREIQLFCRHRPCFQTENKNYCTEQDCQWRKECHKLIAIWHR